MKIKSSELVGTHYWEIVPNKIPCDETPLNADLDKVLVALDAHELEVVRKYGGRAVCKRWQKVGRTNRPVVVREIAIPRGGAEWE